MALNDWSAPSTVRAPRSSITLNGTELTIWSEWEVINNPGHYSSDTFTIKLPFWNQSADFNLSFFTDADNIAIEIKAGIATNGQLTNPTSFIKGAVDTIEIDVNDGTLSLTGRDYSAALIETRINETAFVSKTSSEVATTIAENHGFSYVIKATTTPIGVYYNDANSQTMLSQNATEWDFLTMLADREGFKLMMTGQTLVFNVPEDTDNQEKYIINLQGLSDGPPTRSNVSNAKMTRAMTVARDIVVKVHSADPLTGRAVVGTFKSLIAERGNRAGTKPPPQLYDLNRPRLTSQQAQQLAESTARAISKQERVWDMNVPGDPLLSQFPVITVTGTGTSLDQDYYIDRLSTRMASGKDGGFWAVIRVKNTSVGTQFTADSS